MAEKAKKKDKESSGILLPVGYHSRVEKDYNERIMPELKKLSGIKMLCKFRKLKRSF